MTIFAACLHFIMAMALMIPSGISKEDTPSAADPPVDAAIQEMERANYFAFVMLLNMAPDKIPSNITFLMPNNRMLGRAIIPPNDVLDFLLRHSIPTPLGFEYLKHLPTGSIIPSSDPKFMLKVSNHGRSSFFLNDVKLISPDICTAGYSIRCHGIDGLLLPMNETPPLPTTHLPAPSPNTMAPPPSLPPASGGDSYGFAPAATPQPTHADHGPRNSGPSCVVLSGTLLGVLSHWVLLSILWCFS